MYGIYYSTNDVFDVRLYGSVSSNVIFMPNYCYCHLVILYAYTRILVLSLASILTGILPSVILELVSTYISI